MDQPTVVLEGSLKYRDGKKWKPRWCMIRKLSPAADRLHISLYKSAHDRYCNGQGKVNIPLDNFYGIASELQLDHEQHVMAIICQRVTILLAFQNSETLLAWVLTVRKQLGEEHQFEVELIKAPPLSRLFQVHYTLYIQGTNLCLISGTPPKIHASWLLCDIKKFGIIDNKFCFEAGIRCEKLAGLYVLQSDKLNEICEILQAASAPSRPSSSSHHSSRSSLYSSHSVVSDLQSASLPRGSHRRDLTKSDHNHLSDRGLIRCATVSEADCKRPSGKVHLDDIAQSTPNIQQRSSSQKLADAHNLKNNTVSVSKDRKNSEGGPRNGVVSLQRNSQNDVQNNQNTTSASCDKNCDNELKSRRYSSGDIYLSTSTHRQHSHTRLQAFGAAAAAIQELNRGAQEASQSRRSLSQADVTDFYITFQNRLDFISPKLNKPSDWSRTGGQSEDSLNTGSSSCGLDLESHGQSSQGYTSNSSLNLSEILQTCSLFSSEDKLSEAISDAADVRCIKSLSSGSSTTSTRELFDTPTVSCSIGSLNDVTSRHHIQCNHISYDGTSHQWRQTNCHCKLSNSVTNLACSLSMPSKDNPVVTHSFSWTQLNRCPSDVSLNATRHQTVMHQENNKVAAASKATLHHGANGIASTKTDNNNLCKPLRYVDLSQYDGIDDGYIYCLNRDSSTLDKKHHKKHADYQNIPKRKQQSDKMRTAPKNVRPNTGSVNHANFTSSVKSPLSIHGSLRRPQCKGTLRAYFGWGKHELEQIDNKLAGEYVSLKEEKMSSLLPPPRPARVPKTGSLENILECDCDKHDCKPSMLSKKPGCDLSAVVPTHLAAYSKDDLLQVLAKPGQITDNKLADSLEKLAVSSQHRHCHDYNDKCSVMLKKDHQQLAKDAEYIVMASTEALIDDNNVFCAVELPQKPKADNSLNNMVPRWGKANSKGNNSTGNMAAKGEGYLDMSLGRKRQKQPPEESLRQVTTAPGYLNMVDQSRTQGEYARSMEGELDVAYVDMNLNQPQMSPEYMFMAPWRTNISNVDTEPVCQRNGEGGDCSASTRRPPVKPFENLIQHKCYSEHKAKDQEDTESVDSGSKVTENSSLSGDKSSSEDDGGSQKSGKKSAGKSPGLFSRFIKRNSLKNQKEKSPNKNEHDKGKMKQSHSSQDFRKTAANQKTQEKRRSLQNPKQHGMPIPNQTTAYNDLASSLESDSASSRSVTSSHRSDSPADSSFVVLSNGLGLVGQLGQHGQPGKEVTRSSFRASPMHEQYGSCPQDVSQSTAPPALPPKTYKKFIQCKGKLPIAAPPVVRRHSSEDQPAASKPTANSGYTNCTAMEPSGKENTYPDVHEVGNAVTEDRPPPLPEKTLKGSKKSLVGIAGLCTMETVPEGSNSAEKDGDSSERTSMCCVDIEVEDDDVFLDDASSTIGKTARNSNVLPPSESTGRRRKCPNLTVAIPATSSEHSGHCKGRTTECKHEDNRLFQDHNSVGLTNAVDDVDDDEDDVHQTHHHMTQHPVRTAPTVSRLSTGSLSSCDSSDLQCVYTREHGHVSSPAITTMRPRFGKEYRRVDRRRLAEELNMPLPGASSAPHSTEPSPSMAPATVFTFDCIPRSGNSGDMSPKYPAHYSTARHSREPAYVNLSFAPNSPSMIIDSSLPPPQSPGTHSVLSENAEVLLNYAEIDLSESGRGKKPARVPVPKKKGVEYAIIDMVATEAASRVGREHAQLREEKLLQMNRDANTGTSCGTSSSGSMHSRGSSVTLPNPTKDKRTTLGRSNSTSSRDKRF